MNHLININMKVKIGEKEYTTFEAGKNATELGIDLSRKFIYLGGERDYMKYGQVTTLIEDDNTTYPWFKDTENLNNGKRVACSLSDLAYYDEEPFKVGERVRVLRKPSLWDSTLCNKSPLGNKFPIIFKIDSIKKYSGYIAMSGGGFGWALNNLIEENNIEKVEEPKEEKHICSQCNEVHPIPNNGCGFIPINLTNTKPTGNKFMKDVIKFAKNLGLTADEKELREAGFQDENGNWTSEARQVVCDMKAKALKFNDLEDLISTVAGGCGVSHFELQALFVEYHDKLIDIAKKFNKENKK